VETQKADAKLAEAEAALEAAQAFQPKRMEWFREQGIVFDKAPGPVADVTPDHPDYWQHVAFAIYTDLCEVESITGPALRSLRGEPANDIERLESTGGVC
jgi:hypothetical protein